MGPLVRSVSDTFGTGIIERVRRTNSFPLTATNTSGYVVWFPSYHNGSTLAVYNPQNLFYFENANPQTNPINTLANPMGSIAADTTGTWLQDPATAVITGTSPFSRAKCIASCITADYVGAVSEAAGQVCVIKNYSLAAFNTQSGAIGQYFTPPSVDQIFNYSSTRERIRLDGHEVVWRPTEEGAVMRTNGMSPFSGALQILPSIPDSVFWGGSTGGAASQTSCSEPNDIMGICVAWKGVPAKAAIMSIGLVKVLECELAARSNLVETDAVTKVTNPTTSFAQVTAMADTMMPGWQNHVRGAAAELARNVYKTFAPKFGRRSGAAFTVMDGEL